MSCAIRITLAALLAASALTVAAPGAAAAEEPNPAVTCAPGEHIRVTFTATGRRAYPGAPRQVEGTFAGQEGDNLLLMTSQREPLVTIPAADIVATEIRLREGRRWRSGGIGLLVGGAFGALVGYSGGDDPPGILSMSAGTKAAVGGTMLGLVGLIIGLIAGPGAQWQEAPCLAPLVGLPAAGVDVDGGGARLGVLLAFGL